jgi:L-aspartate oxidase
MKYGIDITKDMIPVSPAAHYMCGGIKTDEFGRTNIKNLYAIGECACTEIHGADRLASNSMTEGLVFGARLVEKIKNNVKKEKIEKKEIKEIRILKENNIGIRGLKQKMQKIMWNYAGIIRNAKGLEKAKNEIDKIIRKIGKIKQNGINKKICELENMALVSKIIIASALRRKESRGTHFISDYPIRDDLNWKKHMSISKENIKSF